MAGESSPRLRRVVVALDATGDFAPAIGFGGIAAAAWGTDLHALFAQDRRLRRAAGLQVVRQFDPLTATGGAIDADALRAELSALAARMRREVQAVAERHGVSWSFEIEAAAEQRDGIAVETDELLVVGAAARPMTWQFRVESGWRDLVGARRRGLLLVNRGVGQGEIVVMVGRDGAGRTAMPMSIRIARSAKRPLTLILGPGSSPEGQAAALKQAQAAGVRVTTLTLPASVPALLAGMAGRDVGLLVVEGSPTTGLEDLSALLDLPLGGVLVV